MRILQGIIDIHAHADPDRTRRSIDVLELAKMVKDRGCIPQPGKRTWKLCTKTG